MNKNEKVVDILLIEDSANIIDIFSVLTKKFNLTIHIVKNTFEFMKTAQSINFKYILCDLHLDYKFEGLFITRVYSNIRKIKNSNGKALLFSSEKTNEEDATNFGFDGQVEKDFLSIYEFLLNNFPLRSYQELIKKESHNFVSISS